MICAWDGLLSILPLWMRQGVDRLGRDTLQELRMRLNLPPVLIAGGKEVYLERKVCRDDLHFCVNAASRYSPWTASTASNGYITAPGGHRIGLCGNARGAAGSLTSIQGVTSLCLRVSRDFPGIGEKAAEQDTSVLVIGSPGTGKTTLLRDLIRQRSDSLPESIAVVDEREEIFPQWDGRFCFPTGIRTDILYGCSKKQGIDSVLRCMGPGTVAIDEITAKEDCDALLNAAWCGVKLMATAHAGSLDELKNREIYRPILENRIFHTVIILRQDKSWYSERLNI